MAVVAVRAVVDVAADTPVVGVGLRLLVTVGAGKDEVVARVGMARRANTVRTTVIHREVGMVESRPQPASCVVARGTGGRESRGRVVGVVGGRVISFMTRVTVRGQGSVVVVHVTLRAGNLGMKSGQREWRAVVIEAGGNPRRRVVTHVALLRETRG